MIKPTFTCDICGAEKKETNHWLLGDSEVPGLPGCFTAWMQIRAWNEDGARGTKIFHLCGEECAGKFQSKFLGSLKGQTQ